MSSTLPDEIWIAAIAELSCCQSSKRGRDAVCLVLDAHHRVTQAQAGALAERVATIEGLMNSAALNDEMLRHEIAEEAFARQKAEAQLSCEIERRATAEGKTLVLETFHINVMEWARGRCECCGWMTHEGCKCKDAKYYIEGEKNETDGFYCWTPPAAWEVKGVKP